MNTRASILIAAILCVIGSALCQNPPTAPKLPQQFTTNYTIVFPEYPSSVSIGGFFALDVPHGGAFADMGGEEFIPVSFHTNLVASPDSEGIITSFMYEGPLCWNMSTVALSVFADIPFQIPEHATFLGNGDISGQSCTGWFFELNIWGSPIYVTMWVSTSKSNNIVQIQIDNLMYFKVIDSLIINFFNTVVGPFSPYIYSPPTKANPSLTCTPAAWNSNPMTALFRK